MYYLDENIEVTVTGITSSNKTCKYEIRTLVPTGTSMDYVTVFTGNCFIPTGETTHTFYLTNILNELFYKDDSEQVSGRTSLITPVYVSFNDSGTMRTSNSVIVYMTKRYGFRKQILNTPVFDYTDGSVSSRTEVLLQGYNPTSGYMLTPKYPYISTDKYSLKTAWETGFSNTNKSVYAGGGISLTGNTYQIGYLRKPTTIISHTLSDLYSNMNERKKITWNASPTYDMVEVTEGDWYFKTKDEIQFGQHGVYVGLGDSLPGFITLYESSTDEGRDYLIPFVVTGEILEHGDYHILIYFEDGSYEAGIDITYDSYSLSENIGKTVYLHFTTDNSQQGCLIVRNLEFYGMLDSTQDGYLYHNSSHPENSTFMIIEKCPSRFYLQWRDRGGSYQSQPFNDYVTYSETFNRNETQNYQGIRKQSTIGVQPKWRINSDWITEDVYPIYESIYTSPSLILYDTQEDEAYKVIVTGDYVEKTYKNQKTLFNINLDLESANNQKFRY